MQLQYFSNATFFFIIAIYLFLHFCIYQSRSNIFSSKIILSFAFLAEGVIDLFFASSTDLFLVLGQNGLVEVAVAELFIIFFWLEWFLTLRGHGQRFFILISNLVLFEALQQHHMGNQIYAYISHSTVLTYTTDKKGIFQKVYEGNKERISVILGEEYSPIYEMSTQLFKRLLKEQSMCQNKEEQTKITILHADKSHQNFLKDFASQRVKLQLLSDISLKDKTNYQFTFPANSLFNFKNKASAFNFQNKSDITQTNTLQILPQAFLLVQLTEHIHIFKVQNGCKQLIYRSNFDESFHLTILTNVLKRENEELMLHTISQIVQKVIQEGNHENSDLLIEDIFGKDKCSFIGLPPKLIGSSLGKFAIDKDGKSTIYDQLKSVILAFAINLAKQINHQSFATKISKTIFIAHELHTPAFLHLVQGIACHFGEIWFYSNGMKIDFVQRLASSKVSIPYKQQQKKQT